MNGELPENASSAPRTETEGIPAGDVPRLRLRSLKVHAFRDVRPGTELRFGDGFHLILGKNATGKSTLLELLAAVSTLNFRGAFFAETPFHLEAAFEVGKVSLHAEVRRTFEPQRMESVGNQYADLPLRDEAEVMLRVEHPGASLLRWVRARTGEELIIFTEDPSREQAATIPASFLHGRADPFGLPLSFVVAEGAMVNQDGWRVHPAVWQTYLRLSNYPGAGAPFDEALGIFHMIAGSGLTLFRGKNSRSRNRWLPHALDFNAEGEPVTRDASADPLLKNALKQLGYDEARVYFGPGASASNGWSYSAPSFQFLQHNKAVRRHDQLSFGQQRLFSFAWYLACNPDVAIADELVNGLHSEWIEWCVEAMRDRQCFLTSQNPILVDAVPFTSEEDVRRGIILCEVSHAGDASELSWRQLDERETALIGGALRQSRIDLLSDLLHALDLW
jgi:energy-coupling factor transporter ATP-binding protein EcfA2